MGIVERNMLIMLYLPEPGEEVRCIVETTNCELKNGTVTQSSISTQPTIIYFTSRTLDMFKQLLFCR